MKYVSEREILGSYKGRRVLVTGHTGFKGSWLVKLLQTAGAEVTGYSLDPPTDPSLFVMAGLAGGMESVTGDVRDFGHLKKVFEETRPEFVFHLAAQPIVRASYKNPVATYETNVMGTVYMCEAVRTTDSVKSFLNVTTDKVYDNREWCWGYRECEPLDGYDPYSNSKSCSELVTHCYKRSFFDSENAGGAAAVSTARAGNVIGGGDFASDRIIPDCVRAAQSGEPLVLRNPASVRPYQHVLEPLFMYLRIAALQPRDRSLSGSYNIGPDGEDCVSTGTLAGIFQRELGNFTIVEHHDENAPHEANFLRLDTTLAEKTFGHRNVWHIGDALKKTAEFYRLYLQGAGAAELSAAMEHQADEYMDAAEALHAGD